MSAPGRLVAMLDSGLGGLTVLGALRALAPDVDVIYFADTANVPYGDRSLAEVAALGTRIVERLVRRNPAVIAVASGTTCAAFDACGWPQATVPFTGMIEPGARAALSASTTKSIGVVATRATIDSGCFARALRALDGGAQVTNVSAPALVPIVEAGESASERAQTAVAAVCRPFVDAACDAVILGCTHFPHLRTWFAAALGPSVRLVDPADACAALTAGLLPPAPSGNGTLAIEVSGDERVFAQRAKALGVTRIDELAHVPLDLGARAR
ncbi:MAG: glutamate racemase [Candidatus Eremiobacteraeota bacterium]|nr:glutamate racemase [Candidatus Eremiobacteraeota bacterium]